MKANTNTTTQSAAPGTELSPSGSSAPALLEGLTNEARLYRATIEMNLFQLARVFLQAKELVAHGEWKRWLDENAGVSERTAQQMMATYRRFGGKAQFQGIGSSKMLKLLALPEGAEEAFAEAHDLDSMTVREVEKAVKAARAEAETALEKERGLRQAAETRARQLAERPPEIPEELTEELQRNRGEVIRLTEMSRQMLEETLSLRRQNAEKDRELEEQNEMLQAQQEEYNRLQAELLSLQSAQARGDAERAPMRSLTAAAFSEAAQSFLGKCFMMPQMRANFCQMDSGQKGEYEVTLLGVEKFCREAREALEATAIEGMVL